MFFKVLNLSDEGVAVEPAEPDEEPIIFPLHVYALVTLLGFLVLHVALFTNITRHVSVSKYADPFAADVSSTYPRFRQWSGTERVHPSNSKRSEGGGSAKERQQQSGGGSASAAVTAAGTAWRFGGDGATKCSATSPTLLRRQ